jgi:hypothetical protein
MRWIGNGIFLFSISVLSWAFIVFHTSEAAASAPIRIKSISFGNLRGGSDTVTKKSTESGSDHSSIHDPPGYIAPGTQDLLLLDITHKTLCSSIANLLDVEYLGPAKMLTSFPLKGKLFGLNSRLMINFSCRKCSETRVYPFLNVIFLVDTGSPNSYLCTEAMQTILGKDRKDEMPNVLTADINQKNSFDFYLSPIDKHYKDVNVLGMDFLARKNLSILMDRDEARFQLRVFEWQSITGPADEFNTAPCVASISDKH